ncbi:MAG: radical SAM protein [Pseudomonadota bacterium]
MAHRQHTIYKHIFGPVPSRRLGISLGVDLVPHKTCTLDCVYCECGKTTCLTLERKEYVPPEQINAELDAALSQGPELDVITFSGAGEPTLYSGIGEIIRFIKTRYPKYRVAVLTNGTLLFQPGVREEIIDADIVKVSLDAVSEKGFFRINRPHADLELSGILDGLNRFRKRFERQFWVEVFLLEGFNDSEIELNKIKETLSSLQPDRIQLNTLDRPGTEGWIRPLDGSALKGIAAHLYNAEIIEDVETIKTARIPDEDPSERILSTIKRRPCTVEDVSKSLGIQASRLPGYLDALVEKGEIEKKEMQRGVFYRVRDANLPKATCSRHAPLA